ncbi:hypothetical protein I5L32_27545, partial [Pseudomonas aeruginosa]|nr:hypothetical protein [Pseudomonas aeruginosa]
TTLAGLVLGEAGRHPVVGALAVPEDHGVAPPGGAARGAAARRGRAFGCATG